MLALGLFAGVASVTQAQTSTPATTTLASTPTTTEATSSPESIPTADTQNSVLPTTAGSLSPAEQTRVVNLAANISNQLEASLTRFEMIANRLDARAERIANRGGDVSIAYQYINELRAHTNSARVLLQQIDQRVGVMATAANPAAAWQPVKQTYRQTNAVIGDARTSAIATVAALKVAAQVNPE